MKASDQTHPLPRRATDLMAHLEVETHLGRDLPITGATAAACATAAAWAAKASKATVQPKAFTEERRREVTDRR